MHPGHREHPLRSDAGLARRRRVPAQRRRRAPPGSLVFVLLVFALVGSARAEDRRVEAAAKDALRRAQIDYRAVAYDRALARLQKAERACGARQCSRATHAALLRDIGVMHLVNGEEAEAQGSFAAALQLDPTLQWNSAYAARDLRAAWEAARKAAHIGERPPPEEVVGPQPTGDFTHTPAPEQAVKTPLPVYVEYGGAQKPAEVVVKYKAADASAYKRASLTPVGNGWGGVIPCADVTQGLMRYYVQGFDASGEPILNSGDPRRPYTVPIRASITAPPPSLPGQSPPKRCGEGEGEEAAAAEEAPKKPDGKTCEADDECASGTCSGGRCGAPKAREGGAADYARFWVGVAGSLDLVSLPSASDACKLGPTGQILNSAGYACTDAYGFDFPANTGQNDALAPGNAGSVGGGFVVGNVRIKAIFDYAVTANLLVGGTLGYVLDTYPGQIALHFPVPLHLEARGTYVFGDNPLGQPGFAPLVFAAVGASEFDADLTITVIQNGVVGQKPVQAWYFGGPWFLAAGGGVRYGFSQRWGFLATLRASAAFGANGFLPSLAPEVGVHYGF